MDKYHQLKRFVAKASKRKIPKDGPAFRRLQRALKYIIAEDAKKAAARDYTTLQAIFIRQQRKELE